MYHNMLPFMMLRSMTSCRHELTPQDADWVTRVFRATGIKTCSFFLPKERLFEKMSRVQYVEYVRSGLFQLGVEAAKKAIRDWGGDVQDITHIIWVSEEGPSTLLMFSLHCSSASFQTLGAFVILCMHMGRCNGRCRCSIQSKTPSTQRSTGAIPDAECLLMCAGHHDGYHPCANHGHLPGT